MLRFKRPRQPNGQKNKSQAELHKLGQPGIADWPKWRDDYWQDLKPNFMKAQYQKCGYCEIQVSAHGDVEHYRPKSEVQHLTAEGTELANSRKLRGRKRPAITEKGYWWLAYEWSNYLLSCAICNQKYKSALFPVAPDRTVRQHDKFIALDPSEVELKNEKPLLLNPFEKNLDPFKHFEFMKSGLIKPRNMDPRGKATIRVCGLHRISLQQIRGPKATEIWDNSEAFLQTIPQSDFQRHLATNLYFSGHKINSFAGMTRVIFQQVTTLEWSDLEALIIHEGWMPIVKEKTKNTQITIA